MLPATPAPPSLPTLLALLFLLAVGSAFAAGPLNAADPTGFADPGSVVDDSGPIVLELFTSQGCSSCPPADRLLTELGEHDDVAPLSFHVDYWNYIGWTDPFSSADWSARQRTYARALAGGRAYTPQLVIDGQSECVGSDRRVVEKLIAEAKIRPRLGQVRLSVRQDPESDQLHVRAVANLKDGKKAPRPFELLVALVETELVTSVKRGENASRTLRNDHVVRQLERAGEVRANAPADTRLVFETAPGWRADHLEVIAYLRDPKTLEVHGAARWRAPSVE
jgi:hypothetical protein